MDTHFLFLLSFHLLSSPHLISFLLYVQEDKSKVHGQRGITIRIGDLKNDAVYHDIFKPGLIGSVVEVGIRRKVH